MPAIVNVDVDKVYDWLNEKFSWPVFLAAAAFLGFFLVAKLVAQTGANARSKRQARDRTIEQGRKTFSSVSSEAPRKLNPGRVAAHFTGCATTQYGDRARYAGPRCENGKRALYAGMKCRPSEAEDAEASEDDGNEAKARSWSSLM